MFRMLCKTAKTNRRLSPLSLTKCTQRTIFYEAGMSYLFFKGAGICSQVTCEKGGKIFALASISLCMLGWKFAVEALEDVKSKESLMEEYIRSSIRQNK